MPRRLSDGRGSSTLATQHVEACDRMTMAENSDAARDRHCAWFRLAGVVQIMMRFRAGRASRGAHLGWSTLAYAKPRYQAGAARLGEQSLPSAAHCRRAHAVAVQLRLLLAAIAVTMLVFWLPGAAAQERETSSVFEAVSTLFQRRELAEAASAGEDPSAATRSLPRADRAATASVGARGKRIALVIGNDAYESIAKLDKAGNDAVAMARELKAVGFEVWPHRNLSYRGMVKAVDTFLNRVSGGDEVVVFFAGHGVQLKSGSYLLPVDIEATGEREVELASLGLSYLAEKLSEAKALFTLLIVDACRDNPLRSKDNRSIGSTRGLQPIEPAKGQVIVYSASKGQQALDRLGDDDKDPNGVFTRELIKRMKHPGMRVEDVVREVQDAVEEVASRINHEQRPAIYNEARGSFYFVGPTTAQTQPSANGAAGSSRARTPEEIEDGFWDRIKDDRDSTGFQAYLNQYPKGRYATQAQLALSKLKTEAPSPAAATANVKDSPKLAPTTREDETRTWAEAKASGLRANLESYLTRYPNGKYVALARIELQGVDEREKAHLAKEQAAKQQEATRAQRSAQRALPAEPCRFGEEVVGQRGITFVRICGGSFMMGSPESEAGRSENEGPLHQVTVGEFWLAKTEVTYSQYVGALTSNAQEVKNPNVRVLGGWPIGLRLTSRVSWIDANRFCTALGYRLPSEAEWEYAARAGTRTRYSFGDVERDIDMYALYQGPGSDAAELHGVVARKQPNAWGLYDMHGSVWEWVQDCYHGDYNGAPNNGSAWDGGECSKRVVRGGAFESQEKELRSASRRAYPSDGKLELHKLAYKTGLWRYIILNVGFRCARDPEQQP